MRMPTPMQDKGNSTVVDTNEAADVSAMEDEGDNTLVDMNTFNTNRW